MYKLTNKELKGLLHTHPLENLPEIDRLTRPDKWQHWYRGHNPLKLQLVARAKRQRSHEIRGQRHTHALQSWGALS